MISQFSLPYKDFREESAIDEERIGIAKSELVWKDITPIEQVVIIQWEQPVDNFEYPSLEALRKQFEATGSYSKEQIDQIIARYARLPKYRAQRRSAPRSKKRG